MQTQKSIVIEHLYRFIH